MPRILGLMVPVLPLASLNRYRSVPPIDPNISSAGQLRQQVLGHLSYIQKVPAILFSRELHAENDDLRAHFAAMMDNRQAVFVELIRRAKDEGDFAADLLADDAAYLLLALIQGLAYALVAKRPQL